MFKDVNYIPSEAKEKKKKKKRNNLNNQQWGNGLIN